MDMDISMDIHEKSVDMDMDMDVIFHIHGNPVNFVPGSECTSLCAPKVLQEVNFLKSFLSSCIQDRL